MHRAILVNLRSHHGHPERRAVGGCMGYRVDELMPWVVAERLRMNLGVLR